MALLAYTTQMDLYEVFNRATRDGGRSRQHYLSSYPFKTLHFLLTRALRGIPSPSDATTSTAVSRAPDSRHSKAGWSASASSPPPPSTRSLNLLAGTPSSQWRRAMVCPSRNSPLSPLKMKSSSHPLSNSGSPTSPTLREEASSSSAPRGCTARQLCAGVAVQWEPLSVPRPCSALALFAEKRCKERPCAFSAGRSSPTEPPHLWVLLLAATALAALGEP
uniref:NAD(P)(+)--arginine ADP-ribosyltransferase n=1 Tax=Chrysolophus pictus TaxID=9089 RepID=A0A8C3KXD7_CHRPC